MLLLAHLLGVPGGRLLSLDDVPHFLADDYRTLVARRVAREPLQHITGTAPFRHVELAVGPGVFVPRPETELLVDAVMPHLRGIAAPVVVDLCSGSGALALAVADEVPAARVVAVEYAPAALPWLTRNAAAAARAGAAVEVVAADVRDTAALRGLFGLVDAVVANPPYVPLAADVAPEVRADPPGAVFAGADGLDLMSSVISLAALLLRGGGVVAVEHDDAHGDAVPALFRADGHWERIAAHDDLSGRPRYATAHRRSGSGEAG